MAAGTGELVDFHFPSFPFQELCHFQFPSLSTRVVVLSLFLIFCGGCCTFTSQFFLKRCSYFCVLFFAGFFYVYFHFPICFAIFFCTVTFLFVRRCEQLPYMELSVTSVGAQTDVTDVTSVTDAQSSQCWFASLKLWKVKSEKMSKLPLKLPRKPVDMSILVNFVSQSFN